MKIRRIFISIFFFFMITVSTTCAIEDAFIKEQEDSLGITSLIKESEGYTSEVYEDFNLSEVLEDAISGKINNSKILKSVLRIFGKELTKAITIMASIIVIIIVNSILNCVTEGLENKSVAQVAYYVQFILIVTVILQNFSELLGSITDSINNMVSFTNVLIPVLIALVITTGNITTATIVQPILVFMTSLIGNFINKVAIPVVLVSTVLGIISKISNKVQVERLSKRLKSSTIWIIGIILTVFVTAVSIDGNLGSSVDAVTSKTAKAAVSNLVPVVGKILGDAVDSVIGCGNILKNAVGILGVIVIVAIAIIPIVKLLLLMMVYYVTAAICEPIADEKIVKLLDQTADTFKMLLAFVCSMSVMIIVGTTLTVKISNISGAI